MPGRTPVAPSRSKPDPEPRSRSRRSPTRRAALIATAITVPLVVLLAFALTNGKGDDQSNTADGASAAQPTGVLPAITLSPQTADATTTATCAQVMSVLPDELAGRAARVVRGAGPLVKAWGAPPVELRCGVPRPMDLTPGASNQVIDTGTRDGRTAEWLPETNSKGTVWTVIDRAVYVQVTVPTAASSADVLPDLSDAISGVLDAVCQAYPNPPPTSLAPGFESKLCTHRK
jgi:hypothetical protein